MTARLWRRRTGDRPPATWRSCWSGSRGNSRGARLFLHDGRIGFPEVEEHREFAPLQTRVAEGNQLAGGDGARCDRVERPRGIALALEEDDLGAWGARQPFGFGDGV